MPSVAGTRVEVAVAGTDGSVATGLSRSRCESPAGNAEEIYGAETTTTRTKTKAWTLASYETAVPLDPSLLSVLVHRPR